MELKYIEAPSVPAEWTKRFNEIVGTRDGRVMLRYVWGNDRKDAIDGEQECRYGDTDHYPARYVGRARWILEGYQSSDVFDREEWERHKHILGSFPSDGVWDFIEYHETSDMEFMPLNEVALDRARQWKRWQSKGHARSVEKLIEQRRLRKSLQDRRRQEAAEVIKDEFVEDLMKVLENATATPAAFSIPGMRTTPSGIIVKENL